MNTENIFTRTKRPQLNLIIDILLLIDFVLISGLGFLMNYVLLPGFKRNEVYGSNIDLTFWGLGRHDWGHIHFILSLVFIFLLLLHIVFHWGMIINIYKKLIASKPIRVTLGILLIIVMFVFGVLPIFLKPEVTRYTKHSVYDKHDEHAIISDRYQEHETDTITTSNQSHINSEPAQEKRVESDQEKEHNTEHADYPGIEIYGYMTLQEVCDNYNITPEELCKELSIPIERKNDKLGWLKKEFAFEMDDVRSFVYSKTKTQ